MAEDAGGLAPGKDDNAVWRKIDRKDGAISHASGYSQREKIFYDTAVSPLKHINKSG